MTIADYGNLDDPRYIHVQLPVQGHREQIDLLAPVMNLHYYQLIPGAAFPLMPQRVPTPEPPDWFAKLDETHICDEIPVYNEDSVADEMVIQHNPHAVRRSSPAKICESKRRRLAAWEKAIAGRKRVASPSKASRRKVASPSKKKSPSKSKKNRIPKVGSKQSTSGESKKKKNKSAILDPKIDKQPHWENSSPCKSINISRNRKQLINSDSTDSRKSYETLPLWKQSTSPAKGEILLPDVSMVDENLGIIEQKTDPSPSKRTMRPRSIQGRSPVKKRSTAEIDSESIPTKQDRENLKNFKSINKKQVGRNSFGLTEDPIHAAEVLTVLSHTKKQLRHEDENRHAREKPLQRNLEEEPWHVKEEPKQRRAGPMQKLDENEVQLKTPDDAKSGSKSSESKNPESEQSIKSTKPSVKMRKKPKTQFILSPVKPDKAKRERERPTTPMDKPQETDKAKRERERLMARMEKRRQNSQRKRKNRKNQPSKTANDQPKPLSTATRSVDKVNTRGLLVEKSTPNINKTFARSKSAIEEKKSDSNEKQFYPRSQSAPSRRGVSVEEDFSPQLPNYKSEQIPENILAELNSARELLSRYNLMVDKRLNPGGTQDNEEMKNSPFDFSVNTPLPGRKKAKFERRNSTPSAGRGYRNRRSNSVSSADFYSGNQATSGSRKGKLKKRHSSRGEIKSYLGKMIPKNIATAKEQQDKLEFVVYFAHGKGGKRYNPLILTVSKDWTFKKCIRKALAEMQKRPETAVMEDLKWINRYDVNSKDGIRAIRTDLRVLMGDHMVEHRGSNLSNKPADYTKQFVNKLWIVPRKGLKFPSTRPDRSKSVDWSRAASSVPKERPRVRKVSNSDMLI